MADKDLEEFLGSPVIRKIAENIPKNEHLSVEALIIAVYEYSDEADYDKIQKHLEECQYCSDMVKKEREINPVYQSYKELVPNEMSRKEFWEYIDKIWEEDKKEEK